MLAGGFTVFNVAQVDDYRPVEMPRLSETERVEKAEDFYLSVGVELRHGGSRAYYRRWGATPRTLGETLGQSSRVV